MIVARPLQLIAVDGSDRSIVVGPASTGTPVSGNPLLMAGWDGTNVRTLLTDSTGSLVVTAVFPAGGATAANQLTEIASLASIDGKLPALVLGRVPVDVTGTITANQGGTWNINNIAGTISLPTGAATSALQTTGNSSLSSIDSKTPSLGQALMAASSPVVIASNQSTLPVSVASLPLPAGAATEATLLQVDTDVVNVINSVNTVNSTISSVLHGLVAPGSGSLRSPFSRAGNIMPPQ